MARLPKWALALATLASLAPPPPAGAASTDEQRFNKKVAREAIPLPGTSAEAVREVIQRGKALCTCPIDVNVGRAGVLVSDDDAQAAPYIYCLVPLFSASGELMGGYQSCGNWQPVHR
jgi:hypothetical protein